MKTKTFFYVFLIVQKSMEANLNIVLNWWYKRNVEKHKLVIYLCWLVGVLTQLQLLNR